MPETETASTTPDQADETASEPTQESADRPEPKLGDAGKSALDAERKARAAAERASKDATRKLTEFEKRLKEYEDRDKSDEQKRLEAVESAKEAKAEAERERDTARRELIKHQAGIREGLPESMIARIQGDTDDEIAADAKQLAALFADRDKPRKPAPDPTLGKSSGGKSSTAEQFASAVGPLFN